MKYYIVAGAIVMYHKLMEIEKGIKYQTYLCLSFIMFNIAHSSDLDKRKARTTIVIGALHRMHILICIHENNNNYIPTAAQSEKRSF